MKRVLVDSGSSMDIIFLEILKEMRCDMGNAKEKKAMNLVGFNGEPRLRL